MGRESRHLWVGNIPDNASENNVVDYFTPFGEVDKLEFLTDKDSPAGVTAVVSFLSLQIAAKIHKMAHKMSNNALSTRYHDFSNNIQDPKSDKVKRESRDTDHFHSRKRSVSPTRGRDIKRKIDVGPGRGAAGRGAADRIHDDNNANAFDHRKRVIICHNLPDGHSAHALTSGLYHEFKQIGKIKQLWMNCERGVKTVIVMYHDSQVAHMAYEELNSKMQFGKPLDLELAKDKDAYTHYPDTSNNARDRDHAPTHAVEEHREVLPAAPRAPAFEHRIGRRHDDDVVTDEGASSTLFVGNLSGNVRYKDLMCLFKRYGDIECIDIKESDKGYPYAFIRYYQLKSACAAKKYLNEEILHDRFMKIGYGKGCQTNTVMAMEIDRNCPESKVEQEFGKFGELVRMTYNQTLGSALCTYADTESAQTAIEYMRGRCLGRTGRVKVDFANHEECQEFYNNYERCKASQQLMKYHMDMLTAETERESRKKFEDFRVEERRLSATYDRKYVASPPERREPVNQYTNSSKRYERVERTASRNLRDITPSPPRARQDRSPIERPRHNRSFDNDWKGKGKGAPRKHSDEGRLDRSNTRHRPVVQRSSRGGDEKITKGFVTSRYNSEERELARHIRESRNSSRERGGGGGGIDRADFQHTNMKRMTKKAAHRSHSPDSPINKYSKYKDNGRSKEPYKPGSGTRGAASMMDNDWSAKKSDEKRRESRGGSRGGSPHGDRLDEDRRNGRDKRKKDKRSALSEEEEEILNSLIVMRREVKSRQKKSTRREPDSRPRDRDRSDNNNNNNNNNNNSRRDRESDRRESRRTDNSRRDRDSTRGSEKRKRKRKLSKESTDDSSDDSSSSSSQSTDGEIDVGNAEQKQQAEQGQPPVSDSALDRIAKIISDSTNGQVQLNPGQQPPGTSERYSPSEEVKAELPGSGQAPIQTMIPIPTAAHQPFLNPPPIQLTQSKELLGLLRKYPIMWNGCIALKNDTANVQLHFLSGSSGIAEGAISALPNLGPGPMRIAQRMRLEPNQIEGVQKRMQHEGQWCMMLALPHGTDPVSVSTQTTTLQHGFISYLESKQAAGIINLPVPEQPSPFVLHIFPPCEFTHVHMTKYCPELIEGAGDCGYLLIVIATV